MKYLKLFELYTTGQLIDYGVGDTVVCVRDTGYMSTIKGSVKHVLEIGDKFKVIKIYRLAEDIFLKNDFLRVDVENIETGEISKGWESTRFKIEMEDIADKYNL